MMRDYELPYNITAETAIKHYYRNMCIMLKQAETEEDPDTLRRLMYDIRVCARKVDFLVQRPPDEVVNVME